MATVHHGQPHGEPRDDDSLFGDDLIEADDGEYFFLFINLLKSSSQVSNMILH
jgi:hypothetical protein